jgi:hypothetical protein
MGEFAQIRWLTMNESLNKARQIMQSAAAKAPGDPESFAPYLRAAIAYWRQQEEAAQEAGDMTAQVEAVTQRVECEDRFRDIAGRSYHTVSDAITYEQVMALPN